MQVTKKNLTATKVQLKLVANDSKLLHEAKREALLALAGTVKVQGFRDGKAPANILEKHVAPDRLQAEFLDRAMNALYGAALDQENLRPVEQPQVKVTKFVPFDTLELEVEVEVVGEIKLADYKKFRLATVKPTVTAKDIDAVIADLRSREAEKKDVTRAAKDGDQVTIDFAGVDAKTKEPIAGAAAKGYPLQLGSKSFIPGFEENLIGLKVGDKKTFVVTFPKDYGAKELQNRKVSFTITVHSVQELVEPKLDDALAAKVGPFKTVQELKDDIKKELLARKTQDAESQYNEDLITKLAEKSKVAIPEVLVTEQIDRIQKDDRQNAVYRGQTWQEYLAAQGATEEEYRKKQRPAAELRVKAGLILSAIAEEEKITIATEDLDAQLKALQARYPDAKMQAELAKPQTRREIASRLLTEKTVAKLAAYAQQK